MIKRALHHVLFVPSLIRGEVGNFSRFGRENENRII